MLEKNFNPIQNGYDDKLHLSEIRNSILQTTQDKAVGKDLLPGKLFKLVDKDEKPASRFVKLI